MSRSLPVTALLVLFAAPGQASEERRPRVDEKAMQEAIRAGQSPAVDYASSAAYTHFLRSRLLHYSGEHRRSLDELRLALVTDPDNPYLMVSLAEEYARTGDVTRAEKTLRRVIAHKPRYAPAQLLMGRLLTETKHYARARIHLRRAAALEPGTPDAWMGLAQVEVESRRYDAALQVMEEMAKHLPGESRGFRILGAALLDRGDAPRAERAFQRAVEIFPGDHEAWTRLGQLHEQQGRFEDAEAAWAQALARDPDNLELLLAAGRVALKVSRDARAKAWFDRALALTDEPEMAVRVAFAYLSEDRVRSAAEVLDRARHRTPKEPRLSFYAALTLEKLGEIEQAAKAYEAVPKESDLYEESRIRRASALSLSGRHARALAAFRDAVSERPGYVPAYPQYARALERTGALKDAEKLLRAAVKRWPTPELLGALSENLQRQGRAKDAVVLLEAAHRERPDDVPIRFLLAAALERAGDLDRCLALMKVLLSEQPENAAALNFVGYVLADHGRDVEEAERLLTRALKLRPDSGAFLDSMGWVHYRKGDLPRALEYLERAAKLEPDEPVIIEHLGDAYRAAARDRDALGAYERALEVLEAGDEPVDARALKRKLEEKVRALRSR